MLNSTRHEISTAHETLNAEKIKTVHAIKLSDVVFIMLINVKMPTICWHFNIYEHNKCRAQLS